MKVACECGCGRLEYFNRLKEVLVHSAKDETLRETYVSKRYYVTKECEEPFQQELELMQLLQFFVIKWHRQPATFKNWIRRMFAAKRVMQMQHAIHERTKGFDWARRHAIQSAVLFGAPKFMQGFLTKRYARQRDKRQADGTSPQLHGETQAA